VTGVNTNNVPHAFMALATTRQAPVSANRTISVQLAQSTAHRKIRAQTKVLATQMEAVNATRTTLARTAVNSVRRVQHAPTMANARHVAHVVATRNTTEPTAQCSVTRQQPAQGREHAQHKGAHATVASMEINVNSNNVQRAQLTARAIVAQVAVLVK
jgi:hypothetical protein